MKLSGREQLQCSHGGAGLMSGWELLRLLWHPVPGMLTSRPELLRIDGSKEPPPSILPPLLVGSSE